MTHTGDTLFRRALVGIALATPIWTFVFRSKRANFWVRMTAGAGVLGSYALWARPEQRKELPSLKDTLVGVASAGGLYAIFQVGDRLARRIMPAGTEEIASVYELRGKAPTPLITALLVAVIAPSEELFWRGMVQRAFMDRVRAGQRHPRRQCCLRRHPPGHSQPDAYRRRGDCRTVLGHRIRPATTAGAAAGQSHPVGRVDLPGCPYSRCRKRRH